MFVRCHIMQIITTFEKRNTYQNLFSYTVAHKADGCLYVCENVCVQNVSAVLFHTEIK